MKFELNSGNEHIFFLGAGASADYGLPTWDRLSVLITEQINKSGKEPFEHKKDILSWMNKIGKGKEYDTIDRCITKESRSKEYRSNGLTIENSIFSIMKNIFSDLYKEYEDGWINKLNQKILDNNGLEDRIAFINYNYDKVLDENLLHFDYLTQKERDVDYRNRIRSLAFKQISAFYPHGNFFSEDEVNRPSHLYRHISTDKSELGNLIDAISCYESKAHSVKKYSNLPSRVYLLGLGNGLKVNLDNILFEHKISEVHLTIKDPNINRGEIITFLSEKFKVPYAEIKVYSNCDELIEACFVHNRGINLIPRAVERV